MNILKGTHHEEHEGHEVKVLGSFWVEPLRVLRVLRGAEILVLTLSCLVVFSFTAMAEEQKPKWPGVDEAVVEKYARDLGREAREPFINTDQGDLLLFLFALAGSIGGFVMGYYWHKVFVAGRQGKGPTKPE